MNLARTGRVLLGVIAASVVLIGLSSAGERGAQADGPAASTASPLQLLKSDDSGIVVELTTPAFEVKETMIDGVLYQTLTVPGFTTTGEAGYPELPVKSVLLGIPADGEPQLRILADDRAELATAMRLAPAARGVADLAEDVPGVARPNVAASVRSEVRAEPAAYTSATPYPAEAVTIGEVGYIRRQRFVRLDFHPFQFVAATGQVQVHKRLRVEVSQPGHVLSKPAAAPTALEEAAFEPILRTSLLNYDAARAWRVQPASNAAPGVASATTDAALIWNIAVNQDGLHQLTYSALQSAGVPVTSLDPRTFKLSLRGIDIPLYVAGETDGVFDPADFIVFYGQKNPSKYSTTTVYRLSYGGAQASGPQRMTVRDG